ncbi:MAG: PAS domain-containing protein [Porphyromonadaceae bacterium]|nr:PAS domain-containing protein [Porphyromonadaceae bacterium]
MQDQKGDSEKRFQELLAFSLGMMNGEDAKLLIDQYKETLDNVTPYDIVRIEDRQMQMGIKPELIKVYLEKIVNVITKSINSYPWKKPSEGSFLYYMMLENDAFSFKLNQVKKIIKEYNGREEVAFGNLRSELLPYFLQFREFEAHYVKKENILFPYLEEIWEFYRPLKVMWSLDDDIRKTLKEIIALLESDQTVWDDFKVILGKYFFAVFRMIHKENAVVYPIAAETVSATMWDEMLRQSFEYAFPFIEAPKRTQPAREHAPREDHFIASGKVISETGDLSVEQVLMAFNHLPVDITIVDENDRVLFFNKAKDRFFPRSPAVVGRAVQNCHPPESVHKVEEIIEAFRSGKREKADFWIQMRGKFILIQYFALRDEAGAYRGVIEVSQDVTGIRKLEGERRLLDWS